METKLQTGLTGECSVEVSAGINTAAAMGSGDMDVFATPAMVALVERAAVEALGPYIDERKTTVGGFISMSHIKPSAPGMTVHARAILTVIEGRRLTFHVEAYDSSGPIGEGTHIRYVVDRDKFLGKL